MIRQNRLRQSGGSDAGTFLTGSRFSVSPLAAIKLMQRVETTGSLEPAPSGGHRPPLLEPYAGVLTIMVETEPDTTLVEIQAELECRFDVTAGLSPLRRMLRQLGLRLKRSR